MSIGIWQLLLIFLIVLILFGAGKLPKIMADLAKGIKAFKHEMNQENPKNESDKLDSTLPPDKKPKL